MEYGGAWLLQKSNVFHMEPLWRKGYGGGATIHRKGGDQVSCCVFCLKTRGASGFLTKSQCLSDQSEWITDQEQATFSFLFLGNNRSCRPDPEYSTELCIRRKLVLLKWIFSIRTWGIKLHIRALERLIVDYKSCKENVVKYIGSAK